MLDFTIAQMAQVRADLKQEKRFVGYILLSCAW